MLSEVGKCAGRVAMGNPGYLDNPDLVKVGEVILGRCFEAAGLQVPGWLSLTYVEEEENVS